MKKILIVDDSKVVRKFVSKCLNDIGFDDLREAEDGQVALDLSKEEMPEVVLLDWNMPVMDGLQYLTALRQIPNGADPVVIFCTTENEMSKIQTAIGASANEYIMKPFDGEILRAKFIQLGIMDG